MKRRSIDRSGWLRGVLLCMLWLGCAVAAWADVGRIEAGEGDIRVIADDGTVKPSNVGAGLKAGDAVSTAGEQSWAILRMEDGASFTLRPNTRLRIDKYRYDENQPDASKSWLSLVQGSLRAITGLIGHQNPGNYALNTPTATIGIRGTDHETVVVDDEHATAHVPAGTYDSVNEGETVMHNAQGDVSIQPGKVGFLQHGGGAPRLLGYRPALFQRFSRFDQNHGIVNVLGKIHERGPHGGFTAPGNLRERLKDEMSRPPQWRSPHAGEHLPQGANERGVGRRGQERFARAGRVSRPNTPSARAAREGGGGAAKGMHPAMEKGRRGVGSRAAGREAAARHRREHQGHKPEAGGK